MNLTMSFTPMSTFLNTLHTLKAQGVTACMRGNSLVIADIPSWHLYKLAHKYRKEMCAIAVVKSVFQVATPIKAHEQQQKCVGCKHYEGYRCGLTPGDEPMTADQMIKGCDKFKASGAIYF